MLGLSYAIRLNPRIEKRLATLFTPSPSRVGHPGDPYKLNGILSFIGSYVKETPKFHHSKRRSRYSTQVYNKTKDLSSPKSRKVEKDT